MHFYAIRAIPVAVLAVGLALPRTAAAQVLPPSDRPMTFTVRFAPDVARPVALARGETAAPPTPRTKPHGALFIRLAGRFIVGERIADLALAVTGFAVAAGVAFPIAHREDMEIQVDISYLKYSGGSTDPGGRQTLDGRAVGPTAL